MVEVSQEYLPSSGYELHELVAYCPAGMDVTGGFGWKDDVGSPYHGDRVGYPTPANDGWAVDGGDDRPFMLTARAYCIG